MVDFINFSPVLGRFKHIYFRMKKKKNFLICMVVIFTFLLFTSESCDNRQQVSDSGVEKASIKVTTDESGQTIEQKNIIERIKIDTEIGSIKHLYIISAYTGNVMEYSTVRGKVTSGGKRISPKTVSNTDSGCGWYNYVYISGVKYTTDEVIDEYGSYGESGNYLYWFDAQGNYHQYYPSGGTYLHISDKPLVIRKSNLVLEMK